MRYSIWDPTGNITALVENDIEKTEQPSVAAALMERHPQVEQVGFVRFNKDDLQVCLQMAGGEFCGNAAMSAAALYLLRTDHSSEAPQNVRIGVSGALTPLEAILVEIDAKTYSASLQTPWSASVDHIQFSFQERGGTLPVVDLGGIIQIIIQPDSVFWDMLNRRSEAERAIAQWCSELSAPGLGFMFLDQRDDLFEMTPLVYVPGAGTVFWENSCASGSTAVCMYFASETGTDVKLVLRQPGGLMRVRCDGPGEDIILQGSTRLVQFG